tara:strand:+ start:1358 stop:2161 length:804 start_codon:yes stop_codon:yes gene_type:complete
MVSKIHPRISRNSPQESEEYLSLIHGLVNDKVVSLVGPASYMENSGHGEEIESSDVVVRLNRGIESCKKYPSDLGTRTDILYSCLIEKSANAGRIDTKKLVEEKVKIVCAPPFSDYTGRSYPEFIDTFHELVNHETLLTLKTAGIPPRTIPTDLNNLLWQSIKCKPNTGFMAIYDLLALGPKMLKIYGFSFYLDGFIPGQKSGISEEQECSEEEFAEKAFKSKRHIQSNMWKVAKGLLDHPKVSCDPMLDKILKLETFSKEAFRALN